MDGRWGRGQEPDKPAAYRGPERRGAADRWWRHALDEIDLGVCLVAEGGAVLYANATAQERLGPAQAHAPLQLEQGQLVALARADQLRLEQALLDAQLRGLRHLISLGRGAARLSLSVLPLQASTHGSPPGPAHGPAHALLVLGKRHLCGELPMLAFAREHQLTAAEQQVLQALCEGLQPQEIASRHGVAISTVRTQIASVRAKTATESIRDLVALVAQLPPMQGVLRAISG